MFYATNKLRRSAYLYTPSGRHNKAEALLLLSLSVLHLFSYPLKKAAKKFVFFTAPFLFFDIYFDRYSIISLNSLQVLNSSEKPKLSENLSFILSQRVLPYFVLR